MPGCKVWDLVKVPFPYTNRPVQQRRPALVVGIPDGLPVASVVRPAKIATIEARDAEPIGRLPSDLQAQVAETLRSTLDPAACCLDRSVTAP